MGDSPGRIGGSQNNYNVDQTSELQPLQQEELQEGIRPQGSWRHRAVRKITAPIRFLAGLVRRNPTVQIQKPIANRDIQQVNRPVVPSPPLVPTSSPSHGPSNSHTALARLEDMYYQAAEDVISEWLPYFAKDPGQSESLGWLKQGIRAERDNNNNDHLQKGDLPVEKPEVKHAKGLSDTLRERLKEAGIPKDFIENSYRASLNRQLNDKEWNVVDRIFASEIGEIRSTLTPASKLSLVSEKGGNRDIFETSYKGGGVSSQTVDAPDHAVNLWTSSYKSQQGKISYQGVRHGIHSAFGIKDDKAREAANITRAKESVLAALTLKPGVLNKALAGESVPSINLTSTSLVTPDPVHRGRKAEKNMLIEQQQAFKEITKTQPVTLEIVDSAGNKRTIKVNVKLLQFNFGVNQGAVGKFSGLVGGWGTQDRTNSESMRGLLGSTRKNDPMGGMVREHLNKLGEEKRDLERSLQQSSDPEYRAAVQSRLSDIDFQSKTVSTLAEQVKKIYRTKAHHSEGHDAYKLPARVALLTSLMDGVPLSNCKSGKDRTGMLDAEIKFLAAQIERDGDVPVPGKKLTDKDRQLFQDILLKSGNHEVQEYNTGAKGYKTDGVHSIDERVGSKDLRQQVRGLSKAVKA
ncbi:inositol phosphate phosphatase SopB [Endozoicomonadaceae bacterium StTr2]